MRPFVLSLLLLVAVPATAGAATVGVEPYREPPDTDPFGSCGRYMQCPPDMLVFSAAAGEVNDVTISEESAGFRRLRILVRDAGAPVQAGAGCERIDDQTAGCTAGIVGPVQLGDGNDRIASAGGLVSGGGGDDVLSVNFGDVDGGEGEDLLIGARGEGGGGDDVLIVSVGLGGNGDDVLRCFPPASGCYLEGGPGNDLLTGGTGSDRLFGEKGVDLLRGRSGDDVLAGGLDSDRLVGGAGADVLMGGLGADRLEASEDRPAGERPEKDRLNCGAGRRDRAIADRRDRVTRCERVTLRRDLGR